MLNAMGASGAAWPDNVVGALTALAPGHAFTVPEVLFAKITDDERADWQARFSGQRTEAA
jgi:methionyl-tRNA synthetase